jgi:nucleotide-binding universal stress UspA family protein
MAAREAGSRIGRKGETMNRIVIATDGSDGAWAAVQEGVELAYEVGAEVSFVSVRRDIPLLGEPSYQEHVTRQLPPARAALDRAEAAADRRGVLHESEILEGDPAACIAEVARARQADLVVVGSRGHGGLTSALIGSVSRALLTRSSAPVMVVRERTQVPSAA